MFTKARKWLHFFCMVICGTVVASFARGQDLPSSPVPVSPAPASPTIPPASNPDRTITSPQVLAPVLPYPSAPQGIAPTIYPPLDPPLTEAPRFPNSGWFASIEADLVGPHIKNRLSAPVPIGGFVDTVHLPTAELDWVGSPRVELDYRLADGFGEFQLGYRSLVTSGDAVLSSFDIDGSDGVLHSRLNVNVVDLDYASCERQLGSQWDMKFKVGARFASVFFDSQAIGPFLEQRVSNDFRGVGPLLGLDLRRHLSDSSVALYTRMDASALLGRINQSYEETIAVDPTSLIGGAADHKLNQVVPTFHLQAGLSWTPQWSNFHLTYVGGYEFENWWYLGKVGSSSAALTVQGLFLRLEWDF